MCQLRIKMKCGEIGLDFNDTFLENYKIQIIRIVLTPKIQGAPDNWESKMEL